MSTENLKKADRAIDLSSLTDDMVKEIDELLKSTNSRATKELLRVLKEKIENIKLNHDGNTMKAINALNMAMNDARVNVHYNWLSKKSDLEKALSKIDSKIMHSEICQTIPVNDRKYLEDQKKRDREAKSNDGNPHITLVKSSNPKN